ncbi:hypothetical protein HYS94_00935 [Candidatus Daviesbacteria bacterium]|nr:hypothetical protein [Candidatus Daviesbacteria bacterium]
MFPRRRNTIYLWQLVLLLLVIFLTLFPVFYGSPRKTNIFNLFYAKPKSFAGEINIIPKVDLKVTYQGSSYDGTVNVTKEETPLVLSWTVEGNATSCIGRVGGSTTEDFSWKGSKDSAGGTFTTARLDQNNPYVYTIDCQNERGDAAGDSVVINVGALSQNTLPQLINLGIMVGDVKFDGQAPIEASSGEIAQFNWTSLNTTTPYSICLSTGSWPTIYQYLGNNTISESFRLEQRKIYSYRIFCSNESSYLEKTIFVFVK